MNTDDVTGALNDATSWFVANQDLLIQYIVNIVSAVVILIVGMMIAKWVSRGLNRVMTLRGIDATVSEFLSAIARYTIIAFTLIAVLGKIGVQTASVIAVMGAAGLAVGLALQNSLGNFAAGVLLVVFRPLKAGEFVKIGAIDGTVQSVQIFSTTLKTADDRIVVIPNGKIIGDSIINVTREPNRRQDIIVGVAYDSDIDTVKKILGDIVAADKRIMHDLGVTIRLNEMAPSSLNYLVRFWTVNGDTWPVYWDLMENFKRALDKHNIGIPFPQMDVHLHQANTTVKSISAE
ncbi:Small-conductance mechanosensitive channel [Providencia rustigianii]|uniref:Small-conductance mechanosensitive channel n=2 Tax=Providencia rustigianii TaxID=158850 RepID=D1P406_9GAMM|nr:MULTISPECIES: small-conductance mechanosensitive channel MscS [Providencia]EFB71632.1 transporter, small conductance mechanosensitive ion channel MscS family protein [Providencia rustigianii DSM 4541]MTC55340.1 small-conductance mechanosensitive channel MscS [Providencia rustigianii]MTC59988.1 small-conductance mechanosensitive channel MscS [Providencia rustigianii]SPY78317.1 Small-conductance mechanosensitive channel [Providencia rustigianii]SUC27943.1 Small-conductance mechanosensitive ch